MRNFSCLACRQRKVRCDRQDPCSHCAKISKDCQYIPPVRGKRQRTKPAKEGLHAKLKRYEDLLKRYGANVEPSVSGDDSSDDESRHDVEMTDTSLSSAKDTPSAFDETKADIIHSEGSSRYFDRYGSMTKTATAI
jgi:hypothetical protein